jgi:hypothetical protein
MELRRATGTRVIRSAPPPVSGPEYLIAHACFECRKSWKLKRDTGAVCRDCGYPLHEMGRSFKTPKKSDAEQWDKVRALWEAGFRFWSYRSAPDAEPLPKRLRDVDAFIRRNPTHPFRLQDHRQAVPRSRKRPRT